MDISDKDLMLPVVISEKLNSKQLEKIQAEYRDLIWEFAMDLNSPLTAKTYLSNLRMFFDWTQKHFEVPLVNRKGVDFGSVSRKMIVAYKKYLQSTGGKNNQPAAPLTVIKKLSAIKSFYDYLLEKDEVNINPAASVRRPRAQVMKETHDLEDYQVMDLFKVVDRYKSKAIHLHKAILLTLFSTGIRQGALRKLKRKNYKFKEGIYYLHYIDKGGKMHTSPLHSEAAKYINEYLEWMKAVGREHEPEDPLFQPTRNNSDKGNLKKELNASGISYIIDHYAKMISKDRHITPHSARATLIGSLLAAGKELYAVSKDINHKDPGTTARYSKKKRSLEESTFFEANFYTKEDNDG